MLIVPSRISGLIEKLEAGNDLTAEELQRLARLQALDHAKVAEDYASQAATRDSDFTEQFRQFLET